MSSEVETSPILIRFLKRREIELAPLPIRSPLPWRLCRPCRSSPSLHSSTSERFAEMLTNEFSGAALASLRAARLGFPAENARVAGKRRHILHSDAFADM
jgi:hypothetical protein